jgi:Ribbon-helix-helix protein, copG family
MQTETLSLRISKAEIRALRARARKEGISQGGLVRRALRAYGITAEPEPGKSGYDVIKHLLGRSRGGAKDLSTNPQHLKDYGR